MLVARALNDSCDLDMAWASGKHVLVELAGEPCPLDTVLAAAAAAHAYSVIIIRNASMTAGGEDDSMLAVYLVDWSAVPTLLVIWSLACGTVAVGALWSGSTRKLLYLTQHRCMSKPQADKENDEMDALELPKPQSAIIEKPPEKDSAKFPPTTTQEQQQQQLEEQLAKNKADNAFAYSDEELQEIEEEFMLSDCPVNCQLLILLVVGLAINLLLLYYFFSKLMYVMLTFIMIGSVVSLVVIFDAISFPMACISVRLPNLLFPCFVPSMELRHHLVLLAALGIPTLWLVYKSHQHAWILQNFIGVSFALNIVRCAHLPNFRVITMSSILLFFYDIFMVFVTGYLQVSAEYAQQLFTFYLYEEGLAIAYCRCFDVLVKDYSPYFILSMTCYGFSLVLAFVGSVLMNTGQPALLYLVPGTLVPAIIVSWWRGEFQDFWTGKFKPKPSLQSRIDIWASTSEQFQMIQGRGLLYVGTPVIEWMAIPLPVSQKAYNAKWN
ncbi:hypothetical protein HPB47_005696 [Ixodes persulcatus]|uniref:Uncharacterized protein n=1 Tax=Ixodes persulcatus TaxID=34615 RepID=A0AC60PCC4_IXOPE|nr:hypothetical protein HPB47_005696 [Ixodes persulcatus]